MEELFEVQCGLEKYKRLLTLCREALQRTSREDDEEIALIVIIEGLTEEVIQGAQDVITLSESIKKR